MRSFEIGQTIARTARLIGATWRSVGLFLLVVQVLMYAAVFALSAAIGTSARLMPLTGTDAVGGVAGVLGLAVILLYVLSICAGFAGATAGLLKADRGEDAAIGDCLGAGVRMCLPVLGLSILWWLGLSIGFSLLIVPGCILLAMWAVAVPALIGEDTGVIGAFGRSRALTKGARPRIFVLLLIASIGSYAGFVAVSFAIVGLLASADGGILAAIAMIFVFLALFILSTMAIQALLVAIYGELVDLKGDRLSEVFG